LKLTPHTVEEIDILILIYVMQLMKFIIILEVLGLILIRIRNLLQTGSETKDLKQKFRILESRTDVQYSIGER
jgi:hypothetical protein